MANKATQFKKGKDPKRNTKGRPPGAKGFTTQVREALKLMSGIKEEDDKGEQRELTYEEVLAKKIVTDAIKKGDTALRKLIWNYMEGMPLQRTESEVILTGFEQMDDDELNATIERLKSQASASPAREGKQKK